jgi:hypothetical protein
MFLFFKNLFKRRTKQNTFMAKPAPETLETRDLPSAGPAFFVHAPALGPLAHVSANFGDKMVIDYNGHLRNSMSAGSMTILSAALTGASGATGTVDFSSTTNSASNSFHLTVSGLTASTTYSIQIDGATIGQVTTDANGDGSVSLTDLTASVASGSVVTVVDAGTTALQGTLSLRGKSVGIQFDGRPHRRVRHKRIGRILVRRFIRPEQSGDQRFGAHRQHDL